MTEPLEVLLVESRPGAGDDAAAALAAAGHRTHRCHGPSETGIGCVGISPSGTCPLDAPIDVALLVRNRISPRPTSSEDGVRCALRAGVPLVEHGSDLLDPYGPWVARRVTSPAEVVEACDEAVAAAVEPLRSDVAIRVEPTLRAAGLVPAEVTCRIQRVGPGLAVHLGLPEEPTSRVRQALAVRVLDAVRSSGRTLGWVDVHVHGPGQDHPGA